MNTASTSFGPIEPVVQGSSTSEVELGGVYDGSLGDETLTFIVRVPGRVGAQNAQIEILDSSGQKLGQFRVSKDLEPGTPIDFGYGLTASFGSGNLERGDSFVVDLSASVGTSVNPTNPFDGTGASAPGFDAGFSVSAGSFEINGVTIVVAANDSIQTVLERITDSGAGVTATYDAATDSVTLLQKTPGAAGKIELGSDDTGFFAAVKLAGARVVPGTDDERLAPLGTVGTFSSVVFGSFLVNGSRVTVDPSVDSLEDVLGRIEAQAPGVRARFDPSTGEVTISTPRGQPLVLAGDDSGFLDSIGIREATYGASAPSARSAHRFADAKGVRRGLIDLSRRFSNLATASPGTTAGRLTRDLLQALEKAARETLEEGGRTFAEGAVLRSGFGIDFSLPGGRAVKVDASQIERALRGRTEELAEFLLGDPDEEDDGFLEKLDLALEGIQRRVALHLDPERDAGLVVNLRA